MDSEHVDEMRAWFACSIMAGHNIALKRRDKYPDYMPKTDMATAINAMGQKET